MALAVLALFAAVVAVVAVARGGGRSGTSAAEAQRQAQAYIAEHGTDAHRVQALLEGVAIQVGALQGGSAGESAVDELAQAAQAAHNRLNEIRDDFASGSYSGDVEHAALQIFTSTDGLKSAMGALVAYTGNPNPATLARFTSQYTPAREEWDEGVSTIWRLAHEPKPPVLEPTSSETSHPGPTPQAEHVANLPVVRCPTQLAAAGSSPQTPATVSVIPYSSTNGLAAYTNTADYLIAPRGMQCSGELAADGGSQVVVWPQYEGRPERHAPGDGLTLSLEPACASCRAEQACPFFKTLAREAGFPCPAGVPAGETVDRVNPNLVLFEDPPGVAGSGWPSGGTDPANGIVGVAAGAGGVVYRSTCTLPASEHSLCTTSLNDVIHRYG